ncbi:unnamed protein product [Parnassius apollo]|uniref:(apollo) hypothetical protein n=1 Tax=Parnassius apollo TaxID=110799 RepID=A0A8S3WS85_PARAO|nr:unnamed protein product [Parnassius apollo]
MVKQLLLFVLIIYSAEAEVMSSVPAHLIACYRNGGPLLNAPHRLDVFLSIVKRLELSARLDMRLFSASLLRRFRLDGIEQASNPVESEFVLPYRASAFQFYKFKLLMDLFLPSQNLLDMDESLSLIESCLLHKLLSSMVQPWERGDENLTCPLSIEHRQKIINDGASRIHSRCPIENGVIQTDWGPIAPGTVVAAVTASLEQQRVSITDIFSTNIYKSEVSKPLIELAKQDWEKQVEKLTVGDNTVHFERSKMVNDELEISNIWVSTLAGDLAEVVVNQGPRVGASSQRLVVGSNNRWNDSVLPRMFYLLPQSSGVVDWHFTDAEILAGVDGLILASYVPSLDRTAQIAETLRFAHILSLKQITVYIPLEEMQRISEAAVTAFMEYVPSVLQRYHQNCQLSHNVPEMDLIVATDGSWKGYDVEQFMSWIGRALEIDQQRSTIALLHGNTGRWIVPPSNNMTVFFSHIANFTDEWPNRLNLPNILSRINVQLRNQTLQDIFSKKASAGRNTVVLVISPNDQLTGNELERSRELMYSIRSTYFDAYFVYAAQDLTNFKNINNEYMDYSEIFITLTSTNVLDVTNAIDTYLIKSDIPKKVVGAQCPFNGTWYDQVPYEDAILPGRKQYYRIHPFYLLHQARIHVQFRNDAHGRILVCLWRGAETSQGCQTLSERDVYTFNLTTPCPSPGFCPPAYFAVTILSTLNACAHADCRFPNQVGYYIRHSGFRCFPLLGAAVALSPLWKVHLGLSLMISFLYFNQ